MSLLGGESMKRSCILGFAIALFTFSVYAKGPVDKVTGEYTLNGIYHRLVSAHEANGKRPQKGFFLSWRDDGSWYEMDFNDTENTCVNVFTEGQARIGGLVSEGIKDSEDAPQIGRYFGFIVVDGGEPGSIVDYGFTYRVSTDYWSEDAKLALLNWCETGVLELDGSAVIGPPIAVQKGAVVWGLHFVTDGNLQVHNSPSDID
jgi:hypothetical protein